MIKLLLTVLIVINCVFTSIAQIKPASLSGIVFTNDGQPASDVTVAIKSYSRGAITASDGSFEIKRIPAGNYTIEISLIGYSPLTKNINIGAGHNEVINFKLEISASELNEVIIRSGTGRYKADLPSPSLRLNEPLLHVPQNIQVITENTLRDQQIFDMSEAVTRNVSGAAMSASESWGNYANIFMRGNQITAFRNGMNVKMPWGPLLEDMSMVDRIEFVKGPAGFLLANGEPTGIYNVVTKKPTGVTKGEVGLSMGSYDTYRTTIDLDGKLKDDGRLLYRMNFMGQMKNSNRDFDFNNRFLVAPALTYRFDDKTSFTIEYTYQQMKMAMLGSAYVFSPHLGDVQRDLSMLEGNLEPSVIRDQNVFLTLHHQLSSNWKLTGQLAYFNYKMQGSSMWVDYFGGLQQNGDIVRSVAIWDAFSESRLGQLFFNGEEKTGSVTHHILGGLDMGYKNYYADFYTAIALYGHNMFGDTVPFNIYHPEHALVPPQDLPNYDRTFPLNQRGYGRIGENSTSLYLQDEIGFAEDKVRLTLAGRQTALRQNSYEQLSRDHKITPRIGISVSLDKSLSVYGLFDEAFVAQQGKDSSNQLFVPVTGHNVEAGIKKDWAGGKWNSTLSVYNITRNNIVTIIPGPAPEPKMVQTGQTKTKGVELDVRGEISRNISVILNYAYTTGKVTKDGDASLIGGDVPGPGFPKHISNAWVSYRASSGKLKGFGTSLGYQYQGSRPYAMPDYFRVDGNVYWQGSQMRISLNANNILSKYLFSGIPYEFDGNGATTEYYYQIEPAINYRLSLAYRF